MIPNAPNQHSTGLNLAPHPHKWSSFLAMFGGSWHLLKKGCDPNPPKKNEDTKVGDNGGYPKMTVDCRNPMRLLFEHDPKFFVAQIPPSAHQMVLAAVAATPRSSCSSRRLWMWPSSFISGGQAQILKVRHSETPSKNGRGGEVATSQANKNALI